ncbi:xanthine dehydrogenase, partial [Ramicandelaber brevisporus]
MDGKHVITIEGIGSAKNPHPAQERIAAMHGSQCGFCTPGIVMSLYTLLRNNPTPTDAAIESAFDGNLCRCTGYRPILEAARTFAVDTSSDSKHSTTPVDATADSGSACSGTCTASEAASCQRHVKESNGCAHSDADDSGSKSAGGSGCASASVDIEDCCRGVIPPNPAASRLYPMYKFKPLDPASEIQFPSELVDYAIRRHAAADSGDVSSMVFSGARCKAFYVPKTLDELLRIKSEHPDCKLVAGNTEIGIETKFKHMDYAHQAYVGDLDELKAVTTGEDGIRVGANLSLAQLMRVLEQQMSSQPAERTRSFSAMMANLHYFAGHQIRNVATIAGNVATASPISDLNPVLVAARAVATVASSAGGQRDIAMTEFFTGYRKTAMKPDEVLVSFFLPYNQPGEFVLAFKQARRKDDDIAIVNAGLRVNIDLDTHAVKDALFAFGGMAAMTVVARKTSAAAVGITWGDRSSLDSLLDTLGSELQLAFSTPGGMPDYRMALASSFVFKLWCQVSQALALDTVEAQTYAPQTRDIERGVSSAVQGVEQQVYNNEVRKVVGQGVPHLSALKQVTGEAVYTDDIPRFPNELYAGLVLSSKAHAKILSIDASAALAVPGVAGFFSHKDDVPGDNKWGIFHDEELYAKDEVITTGQLIGVVVADDQATAQRAARLVKVEYEVLPHILTIEDAIKQESFFPPTRRLERGDINAGFAASKRIYSGETHIGGQEHFYLETHATIAVPKREDDEMEIFASTQNPTETQHVVSGMLGVPSSRIVCRVKRLGGGFGGKESRSVSVTAAAALPAHKLQRPVRIMLDRDEDMITTGARHPFYAKWQVGVDDEGRIQAADLQIYSNGGCTFDLSVAVLERAMSHSDVCYFIPNMRVRGRVCRTNLPSNTAFRGFGGPQGQFIGESIIEHIADQLQLPAEVIRERNMYKPGQFTHFNQELTDWHVPLMWQQLKESSEFAARRAAVDAFNAANQYRKRGLAMIPTKFGISFTAQHLNQAGALVHIYTDGSVLLTHGGTEMGQGLHTKMSQIAAETLDIPLEKVYISETSTNTVANTSPTAASASSDLNGYAVVDACTQLADRLRPFRESGGGPDGKSPRTFNEAVKAAYFARVNLSANGFYKTPDIGFDWESQTGLLFFYFTQGVAVSEVEVDVLTGDHIIRRSDILMDVGRSLNQAVDIGQIEGAFAQGVGWCTLEELLHFPSTGQLFTRGPGAYKIPGFRDIPQDFRVSLLDGVQYPHLKTVMSSKGIGEPPLFLGASVLFALRDAVKAARKDNGETQVLVMHSPATAEKIRVLCADGIAKKAAAAAKPKDGEAAWAVQF